MKDKPIAFDDKELRNWLMDLIEEGLENFLYALAEAVVRPMPKTMVSSAPRWSS